jgi:hypothetical protein
MNYRSAEDYVEKIVALAKANNVELYFLYLPSIGNIDEKPINLEFYEELAPIIYPPSRIYTDKSKWVDGEHFNYSGSKNLSNWLSEVIIDKFD